MDRAELENLKRGLDAIEGAHKLAMQQMQFAQQAIRQCSFLVDKAIIRADAEAELRRE